MVMETKSASDRFKALGDPTRLRIVQILSCCPETAGQGAERPHGGGCVLPDHGRGPDQLDDLAPPAGVAGGWADLDGEERQEHDLHPQSRLPPKHCRRARSLADGGTDGCC